MSFHQFARRFFDFDEAIALDCEMVGGGARGEKALLGRISMVDEYDDVIFDEYVRPTERVTDYRTRYSGIRPRDLVDGVNFEYVQEYVLDLIEENFLLVGHCLKHDFRVLYLDVNKKCVYDTQNCPLIRNYFHIPQQPSLKLLARIILGENIQQGEHCSIEDAGASMDIYKEMRELYMNGNFVCFP